MMHLLSTARAALLLAALLAPTPYRAPEPPPAPSCPAIVATTDDNLVCWDYAVLYNLRTGVKIAPLYGKPDAATLTMLQSGDYGIAVATHCEAGE